MTRDPLIAVARLAIIAVRVLLALVSLVLFAALMFAIFASDAQLAETATEIVGEGGKAQGRLSLGILFAFTILVAILAERFFQQLGAIVATVPAGNPFAPANADRLQRMAWLAIGFQTISLSATLLSESTREAGETVDLGLELSFEGIFLAILLFILARVFRLGAAMREDLKGTV